jgi:hypothetical protein
VKTFCCHGQEKGHHRPKQNRMRESAMCHQFLCRAKPCNANEVNVRHALRQGTPEHGLLAKLPVSEKFSDAGAKGYMCQGIHLYNLDFVFYF